MAFALSKDINFNSTAFKRFLFSEKNADGGNTFLFPALVPNGFEFDAQYVQDIPESSVQQADFLVDRTYRFYEGGLTAGNQVVFRVARRRSVQLRASYVGLFRTGTPQLAKDHGEQLIRSYNPADHGDDIYAYFANNADGNISHNDFILTVQVECSLPDVPIDQTVNGNTPESVFEAGTDIEILLEEWKQSKSNPSSLEQTDINYPKKFNQWKDSKGVSFNFVGETLVLDDDNSHPDTGHVFEVEDPDVPIQGDDYKPLKDAIKKAIPVDCGPGEKRDYKIATVSSWPEFKIEWERITISIGCSQIEISVPRLRTRTTRMVAYAYVSVPSDFWVLFQGVIQACAMRSALEAAVVGIILVSPHIAAAAFEGLFKRCIAQEALKCLHPGVYVLKEKGGWS